jgi:hypothetical protein
VSVGLLGAGPGGVNWSGIGLVSRDDVSVAGIDNLGTRAIVNWLGGWGNVDSRAGGIAVWLGSWGGVDWCLLGAGAHGGVDSWLSSIGGGVVSGGGLIVDAGCEGRADEGGSSDEMHF